MLLKEAFTRGFLQRWSELEKQAFDWQGILSQGQKALEDPRVMGGLVGAAGGGTLGGLMHGWQGALGGALGGGALGAGGVHLANQMFDQYRGKLKDDLTSIRSEALEDTEQRLRHLLPDVEQRAQNIVQSAPLQPKGKEFPKVKGPQPTTSQARNSAQSQLEQLLGKAR